MSPYSRAIYFLERRIKVLTEEQVENYRKVLYAQFGPFARLLSAEDINTYANNLQRAINSFMSTWEIRVRFGSDLKRSWNDIPKEPKTPTCSHETISDKCWSLLIQYPQIDSIQITDADDSEIKYLFSRDK
jgi:hypothetical protein